MARGELTSDADADATDQRLDESAAAFGLVIERPAPPDCEEWHLWPELVPALQLWRAVQTQWRVCVIGAEPAGMGVAPVVARTGLDYPGCEVVMRRHGVRGKAADEMFSLLQAMERAALDAWAEMRG